MPAATFPVACSISGNGDTEREAGCYSEIYRMSRPQAPGPDVPSSFRRASFHRQAAAVPDEPAVRAHGAMAGDDDRQGIVVERVPPLKLRTSP